MMCLHYVWFILFLPTSFLCQGNKKPNVIVFVTDDWGWGDYGLHGINDIQTPNMDAFAYRSLILSNYYTMPLCTPSRAALMTGMHPTHTGMQHEVIITGHPWGLPLEYKILPEYLKNEGYKTYAIGKWHLGNFEAAYTPTRRGFDYHFGYWQSHQDYYKHSLWDKVHNYSGYDLREGLNTFWDVEDRYATGLFTEKSVEQIINHNVSEPMFLYVAHLAVHVGNIQRPLVAPPTDTIKKFSFIKNEQRRIFAAIVWELDDSFGRIIAALGSKNMLLNSIIIMTTDNGGASPPYENSYASNWPLRGGKDSLWEGGVRGNAAIWSAELQSSKIDRNLMHIQDWVPTILGAINSSYLHTENWKFDGKNMWPILKGDADNERDHLFLNNDTENGAFAFRRGDYKILHGMFDLNNWTSGHEPADHPYDLQTIRKSLISKTFENVNLILPEDKVILELRKEMTINCTALLDCNRETNSCNSCDAAHTTCLFNIKQDPCEINNLAEYMPEVVEKLLSEIRMLNVSQPIYKDWDPQSNPKYWNSTYNNWCDYVQC